MPAAVEPPRNVTIKLVPKAAVLYLSLSWQEAENEQQQEENLLYNVGPALDPPRLELETCSVALLGAISVSSDSNF
jgi:hypothetical protein